jgi:hypothetical protein
VAIYRPIRISIGIAVRVAVDMAICMSTITMKFGPRGRKFGTVRVLEIASILVLG